MSRWVLVLVLSCGCANVTPRYPSWDPVLEDIPRPTNHAEAKRRLAESLALWQRWSGQDNHQLFDDGPQRLPEPHAPSYSYVRAQQLSERRVAFTLLDVERGRVILRAYVIADPDRLSSLDAKRSERDVTTLWIEREGTIGAHRDGAPVRTIDELYAGCAASIVAAEASDESPPQLYFHPHGILMRCGEVASIQDVSKFSLSHEASGKDVKPWVCASEEGIRLPRSPLVHGYLSCYPAFRRKQPYEGTGDICQIDPTVCGYHEPYEAHWAASSEFSGCSIPALARAPLPLEIGKLEPRAEWAFPAVNATSCGFENLHVGPPGRLRYVPGPYGDFSPIFTR